MTITYILEPRDLRAFHRYAQKYLTSVRRARYVAAAAMIGFSLWLTLSAEDHRLSFRITYFCLLMLIFWGVMLFWTFVITYVMQWRAYTSDKHKSVLCEHTVTLADDAFVEATPFNEGRNLWQGIYQVVDTADYIYVFISLNSAHIIPKRAFSDMESARRFFERAVNLWSSAQRAED